MPNLVLDTLLPELKDTELRVLLVLIRQTLGWNRPTRPVILSYRTLKARTGRESEAIAKAIRSLRTRGLIHTTGSSAHKPVRLPGLGDMKSEGQHYKDSKKKEQGAPRKLSPPRRVESLQQQEA